MTIAHSDVIIAGRKVVVTSEEIKTNSFQDLIKFLLVVRGNDQKNVWYVIGVYSNYNHISHDASRLAVLAPKNEYRIIDVRNDGHQFEFIATWRNGKPAQNY